jgi:subtilisin family serine protease
VRNEFLVRFRAGRGEGARLQALAGARLARTLEGERPGREPVRLVELSGGADEAAELARLRAHPDVEAAEPNYERRIRQTFPNDPDFGSLWGLHNTGQSGGVADADIDAPEAWDLRTDASSVVVAVLDSGVEFGHPDLTDNRWVNPGETPGDGVDNDGNGRIDDVNGWDFLNNDNIPNDANGHGTHVAGTIGARGGNATAVAGVCWQVQIMALRFANSQGVGSDSNIIAAFNYARVLKTRPVNPVNLVAINNSWGGGGYNQLMVDAMQACSDAGILMPCAAGNDALDNDVIPSYPANYAIPGVISVGASTRGDQLAAGFSCFGATTVHLFAPGAAILSTYPPGGTATLNGTSMATPHVTGAIALVAAHYPAETMAQIRGRILYNVDRVPAFADLCITQGRLNVFRALSAPADTTAPAAIVLAGSDPTFSAVTLSWDAPGDDGAAGTAVLYELRWSADPITAGNFHLAQLSAEAPLPAAGGTPQTARLHALPESSKIYYFAIRAIDELGNAGPLSNVVALATAAASVDPFADGFPAATLDSAKWTAEAPWALFDVAGRPRVASTDASGADYDDDLDCVLDSAPFSLVDKRDAVVAFVHRHEIEFFYDVGEVYASGDGGSTWTRLRRYTGDQAAFASSGRLRLDAFDGLPDVRLRFRFISDFLNPTPPGPGNFDGWEIDDVVVSAHLISNVPPVAIDQSVSVVRDVPQAITLSGSDANADALVFDAPSAPANGVLSGTPPDLTYTPNAGYTGPDSFTFTVSDPYSTSAAGTVTITVAAPAPRRRSGGRCGLLGLEVLGVLGPAWALSRRRRRQAGGERRP